MMAAVQPDDVLGLNTPPLISPHDAHMAAALTTPIGPPPPDLSPLMSAGGGMPNLPQGMSAKVKGPSPLDLEEGNINGRLMADYKKDSDPYGSPDNHPGFLGKLLHGLNVATGGVNRRGWEEQGLEKRLNSVEGDEAKNSLMGAQTGEANSRADLTGKQAENEPAESAARVGEEDARTDALRNAPEKQVNLPQLHANAVNKALQEGRDPSTDPTVQHLAQAIIGLQPGQNKDPEAPKTIQLEIGGKPHQMAWDAKTGKYDQDQGESGEKPPTIRVDNGTKENNAIRSAAFKAYTPAMDSAERFNVMSQNYEDAVKNHDQQAMLSLLANHLGMTMGLQKGARMTKDIIQEAQQSRPWLQGMGAKFDSNGVLSGVTLTKPQMQQMVGLGRDRYAQDISKARSEAKYQGATDDGPERTPSKSTINFYINQANGDPAKAKELAAQDGWTVPQVKK